MTGRAGVPRRAWLRLAAAAGTALSLPRSAWSQPRLREDPFGLGVASGSPLADGIVLWTRLHQRGLFGQDALPEVPITLRWQLADDQGFRHIVQQGEVQALPELAHSVHVEVQGLMPDRWYHYRFLLGGNGNDWMSPVGRTRTLPAPDAAVDRLRLAYASCQRWEHGHYAAYRQLVADEPDAVVFLGDYIYEYPGAVNAVRTHAEGWALTLADYRRRYALHRSDALLRAAHAACPWFVIWDDHEVQNDYAGLTPGDSGPEVPDFAARRAAAYQAFYEHMPLRASVLMRTPAGLAGAAQLRIHGQARIGRLATLTLLDTRQYKSAPVCMHDGRRGSAALDPSQCAGWRDPARSMLGAAQEAWLDQALAAGLEEGWNLLAQPSLFGPRDLQPGPGELLWNDGWDGYAPARQRLIEALRRHRVANPVLLGGDVHENWVGHVKADYADPRSPAVATEFCGTSITSRSNGSARVAQRLAENPHFVFADARYRGYGLVDLTPRQMQVSLRAVDDVTSADSAVRTLAVFGVAAGRARIEQR
jgi:alkaline phosphatase D